MTPFLLFDLQGPMSAWGDVAVGEKRVVTRAPSKSGVLGLLGAALGIERESPEIRKLHRGYSIATKTRSGGSLLLDYHTTQSVPANVVKKRPARTRREEILLSKGETPILSTREYWCDMEYVIAVWVREGALWSLEELKQALIRPHFSLCLGRLSCPLSKPVSPRIVEAENPVVALSSGSERGTFSVAWEDFSLPIPQQTRMRRDEPGSRTAWLFGNRKENYTTIEEG